MMVIEHVKRQDYFSLNPAKCEDEMMHHPSLYEIKVKCDRLWTQWSIITFPDFIRHFILHFMASTADLFVKGFNGFIIIFTSFISKVIAGVVCMDMCVCVCVCVCVCEAERKREGARDTHMVRRAMFSIQRFGDEHLPDHGVDAEHLVGRLIRSHPGDAVPDGDVLVLVGANLHHRKEKNRKSMERLSVSWCVSRSGATFYLTFVSSPKN